MTNILDNAALAASRPVAVLERAALAHAVNIVTLAIERKNTIPILSNLCLTGDGESLTVKGTDLDIEIAVRVPGAADSRMAITVPAHMLKDILAKARDSELASIDHPPAAPTGKDKTYRAAIDMGGVRFNLSALPYDDFPHLTAEFSHSFTIAADELAAMFDRTKFAISTEETRYYLNGVYLHHVREGLRATATDGHRLAMMTTAAPEGSEGMPGVIVPRKMIGLVLTVLKAAGKAGGKGYSLPPISVQVSASRIRFTIGEIVMTSKLIDGTFPDYQRVIPRHNDKVASLDVAAFGEAVEQVSLIHGKEGRAVKLAFSEARLTLTATNADAGTAEMTIAVGYGAESLDIGFNARYIRDVLANLAGESVTMHLNDAGSPTVLNDPADSRFTAVLMPMRV